MTNEEFARIVNRWKEETGMTGRQIAEILGMHETPFYMVLGGKRRVSRQLALIVYYVNKTKDYRGTDKDKNQES
jgi:plasmid maintenance system antidote protein VapI